MSDYHLRPDQISAFDRDGFVVLPGRIGPGLLERVRAAAEHWVEDAWAAEAAGVDDPDVHFAVRDGRRVMFRVDYVHGKGDPSSLVLLGSPEILGIAESLAGPNFVPTYESLVFKAEGDGAPVPWHQDAVHPRRHRIFNVDIYLDDSLRGQGALRVLPGSQRGVVDVCDLRDTYGWEVPELVEVEARAGDVVVHDVMVVHGSPPTTGNELRRTVYYEFRAAEQILEEGPWDRAWVDRRLGLVGPALEVHREQLRGAQQFHWEIDARLRPVSSGDLAKDLRISHGVHTPGSYCSAGDVPLSELPGHRRRS